MTQAASSTASTVSTSILSRIGRVARAVARGDGRQIRSYLVRGGFNAELAYPLARAIKLLRHPGRWLAHRRAASMLRRQPSLDGLMNEHTGWGVVPTGTVPGMDKVIATLRQLRDERGRDAPLEEAYIRQVFLPADLDAYPEVRDFVLSDALLQIGTDYLGSLPVLMTVQGWWTPPNTLLEGSQLFHVDNIDTRQVKFFFNMIDVGEESGPFSFLPADVTARVLKAVPDWRRRLADEEVFAHARPEDVVSTAGAAGTGFVADGCRCMHFGGRARSGERLVLMISFGHVLSPMTAAVGVTANPGWYPHDRLRRMALGLE